MIFNVSFARRPLVASFVCVFCAPNLFSQPIDNDSENALINVIFHDGFSSLTAVSSCLLLILGAILLR